MNMNAINEQIRSLWEKYHLSEKKRTHVTWVARVSEYIATQVISISKDNTIDLDLLLHAALLHDIDNSAPFLPGEVHPAAAVRILRAEHLFAVADIVKTHSLYSVLDAEIMPRTWEEKILYLSDKMVKYEIITVDARFSLWRNEKLPASALQKLDLCYPLVKLLESEIFSYIRIDPARVATLVK